MYEYIQQVLEKDGYRRIGTGRRLNKRKHNERETKNIDSFANWIEKLEIISIKTQGIGIREVLKIGGAKGVNKYNIQKNCSLLTLFTIGLEFFDFMAETFSRTTSC